MNDRSLLEQTLQAWRVNNSINLKLVRAIPKKGFDAVPLASRGRTLARQLAHLQKVHAGWLKRAATPAPANSQRLSFRAQRTDSLSSPRSCEASVRAARNLLFLVRLATRH